jgi:hypothetical protein
VHRRRLLGLLALAGAAGLTGVAGPGRFRIVPAAAGEAPPEELPGTPAAPSVVAEIQAAVDDALRRFQAMDAPGVLAHVSPQYRTGPLTKAGLAQQLQALFAVHDALKARVRLDAVRMVGEHAWVYSTGDVIGRLRWIARDVPILAWERELEVVRREAGRWRLFGYQQ